MRTTRFHRSLSVLLVVLTALTANVLPAAASAGAPATFEPSAVAAFLDEVVPAQMADLNVPGLAFVLVEDGEVSLARGYGYADLERQVPFDPEQTVVRAGSLAKTVTALAVMQLAEQGLLDLDADVNAYLTSMEVPDAFGAPVTVRQLLHYTAGFDSRFVGIRAASPEEAPALSDYLAERMPPRVRPPGEVRAYNDHEIALAGLLVEEVSGMAYADYVRQHVFQPLGMSSSSFVLPDGDRERTAVGYSATGPYPANYYNLNDAPGAGFNATPADLARYMLAHLNGGALDGRRVLSAAGMAELHTTRFRHDPHLPGIAYTFDETFWGETRFLAKSGGAPGFQNRMLLFPQQNAGVYFVFNRDYTVPLQGRLERAFLERFLGPNASQADVGRQPVAPGTVSTGRYAGYYVNLNDYSQRSIEKVRQLFDQAQVKETGDGGLALFGGVLTPVGGDTFRWQGGDDYVVFRGDGRGRAAYFFEARTAYARLPWYESFPAQAGLLAAALLVFAAALVVWIAAAVRRRGRTYALAGAVSLLSLTFLVGLALLLGPVFAGGDPPWSFSFAPPPALLVLLALPLVVAGLTAGLLMQTVRGWRAGRSSRSQHVVNTAVLLASAAFLFFLNTWNLLGYRL
ncbi:MAG: serine hydrolase [Caldilineales bacterium]